MSETQAQLLQHFKQRVIKFLEELIDQFSDVQEFVIARLYLQLQVSEQGLMDNFIQFVLPLKGKDTDEILQGLFDMSGSAPGVSDRVTNLKNKVHHIWSSPDYLDGEDRTAIRMWLDHFFEKAEAYQKTQG